MNTFARENQALEIQYQRALQEIVQNLRHLCLEHWWPALNLWLDRYHGLEKWILCVEHFPTSHVLQSLCRYQVREIRITDERFINDLSRLGFLCWRGKRRDLNKRVVLWNPLKQSLAEFEAQAREQNSWPEYWESSEGPLNRYEVKNYLLLLSAQSYRDFICRHSGRFNREE